MRPASSPTVVIGRRINPYEYRCKGQDSSHTGISGTLLRNRVKSVMYLLEAARKPLPGQRQLLLRHLDGNLKDLIRDTQRLTVALEYHESLPQGCPGSQRWLKLARPKDQRRQMAL